MSEIRISRSSPPPATKRESQFRRPLLRVDQRASSSGGGNSALALQNNGLDSFSEFLPRSRHHTRGSMYIPSGHGLHTNTDEARCSSGGDTVVTDYSAAEDSDWCRTPAYWGWTACCLLDLGKNTLTFPGGPTVKLILPSQSPKPHP
ncbi:unnamed protein product [Gadus morhua 'NCC']